MSQAAILDIDGTRGHQLPARAIAWYRAFRDNELILPIWRIHRHIGMGGDQLVSALAGEDFEDRHGDDVREAESEHYMSLIEEVEPMDGARDLILAIRDSGRPIVLASSAKGEAVEHYLDLLDCREIVDAWTMSDDVDSTKPEPDLVVAALEKVDAEEGVMVGDTPWDVKAAGGAGVETLAVLTGGFSEAELRDAGAVEVFESVRDLCEGLGSTLLGRA